MARLLPPVRLQSQQHQKQQSSPQYCQLPTSPENSELVDGKGTSTHDGESQESSKQTPTQCSLPTQLKTDGASESSIISNTNPGLASTLSDNKREVMKRKHEHDSCNVRTHKKQEEGHTSDCKLQMRFI